MDLDGIAQGMKGAPGWTVRRAGLDAALGSKLVARCRLWILGETGAPWIQSLRRVREERPGHQVVLLLPPGSGLVDRCLAWEHGCAAVLVGPVWPREVLAVCRGIVAQRVTGAS